MHPIINQAERVLRSAGQMLQQTMHKLGDVQLSKQERQQFSAKLSEHVYLHLQEKLLRAYPTFQFSPTVLKNPPRTYWHITAIAGMEHLHRDQAGYYIVLSAYEFGELKHCIAYDPKYDLSFCVSTGYGAMFNQQRVKCNKHAQLADACVAVSFGAESDFGVINQLGLVLQQAASIRCDQSPVHQLLELARGAVDCVFIKDLDPQLQPVVELIISEVSASTAQLKLGKDQILVVAPQKLLVAVTGLIGKAQAA